MLLRALRCAVPRLAPGALLWCDLLHLEGAQALAEFGEEFYAGRPAISENRLGEGRAYYVATRPDPLLLDRLLGALLDDRGIAAPLSAPAGVEVTQRVTGKQRFTFVLNHHAEPQVIRLSAPARDLLTGQVHAHELTLDGRGVAVLVHVPR